MRVSANKDDAGYSQFNVAMEHGKPVRIFLDGVEVKKCVTADDEHGFVIRHVLDGDGNVQIDPIDKTKVWEERVTGKVEIRFS